MSSSKLTTIYGATGKLEATYNGGGTLSTSTDGILLAEPAVLSRGHAVSGERGRSPRGGGTLKRGTPSGPTGTVPLVVEFAGAGVAYSSSNLAALRTLMRISGHTATLDDGVSWTFAPEAWDGTVPPPFASGVFNLYGRGEVHPLKGAYASMSFEVEAGGYCRFTFDVSGVPGDASDIVLPSITYAEADLTPPKADALALVLGSFNTGKVRRIAFSQNREVGEASIYGFAPGLRAPTVEVTYEKPALTASAPYSASGSFNAEKLRDTATPIAVSFTVGSVAFRRFTFAGSYGIVTEVQQGEDGPVATETATIALSQGDAVTPNDYSILCN